MTTTSIATTTTTSTATPPKLDDEEFNLDLGGDFGTMFNGLDKRASMATVRDANSHALQPRSLTDNRIPQSAQGNSPRPPHSPHSINSDNSNDGLLKSSATDPLPSLSRQAPPSVQRSNRPSDIIEDEDANLLRESIAASKFLTTPSARGGQSSRPRRDDDTFVAGSSWKTEKSGNDESLFDNSFLHATRVAHRYVSRPPSPPRNRVMTPAQFEKYKQEKERISGQRGDEVGEVKDDEDDEENYEDDDDEVEKSKQAAKQRRKQEAHMAVYRQQMMKVTGESANTAPKPSLATSTPTPVPATVSDGSDEDEEIPLAILAAHGFPNKNRPPTRLSTVASNPNLRASMIASQQPSRLSVAVGENGPSAAGSRVSQLPAFARNLPQDPFVGAGLVRNSARESIAMGGGAPAPTPSTSLPPGGLVGVIASEERSRAMRRGSPNIDGKLISNVNGTPGLGFDPIAGIPPQMMYGMGSSPSMPHLTPMGYSQPMPQMMLTPGDQAQIQMTQQMQQFMQMQMQFMQMMATQQGGAGPRPNSFVVPPGSGEMSSRHSFVGGDLGMEPPRLDNRMRTMSMVQPSSASWIQPMGGYAPSIRVQGDGYAPSIAPSERSNIGLPGRYRPVSQAPPPPHEAMRRVSTMSGALSSWDEPRNSAPAPAPPPKSGNNSDDDDEEGWVAMKAKREKKRSLWKSKKGLGGGLSAFIS